MSKNQMPACVKKTTIGGQAILEGIVMKGPKRTCVVVRKPDGTLVTEERPTSQPKSRFWKLPVCRGAYSLFTAMKDGLADIDYSSQFIEDGADAVSYTHLDVYKRQGNAIAVGCSKRH